MLQESRLCATHSLCENVHAANVYVSWKKLPKPNCYLKKVYPRTGHEGPEGEKRYSSTLSLTSALDGGGWLTARPCGFSPGKETRYAL